MTDKSPFDIEAGLTELGRQLRAQAPKVSDRLRMTVLADAGEIAAARNAARPVATAPTPRTGRRGWFGFMDAWVGAAAAVVILFLVAGIGLGYQAGDMIMAEAGFGETTIASAARDGDGLFIPEDVL